MFGYIIFLFRSINQPDKVDEYHTLQEFFTRAVKPAARPLDTKASIVSPCDGQVLQIGTIQKGSGQDAVIESVKGRSYKLRSLIESDLPEVAPNEQRFFMVLHLRAGDYHWIHAPMQMHVKRTTHMAGYLLPTTWAMLKWVPRLLCANERVVVESEKCVVTAVGGMGIGSIRLPWEERVHSNVWDWTWQAVQRKYEKGKLFQRGDALGYFEFGSCVVLIVDLPTTAKCEVQKMSFVRAGQALFR